MDLANELAVFKENFIARADAARVALIEKYIAQSQRDGVGADALRPGARVPAIALPNQHGATVSIDDVLARGPAIVVFYRGGWCPYCNLTLRAYQRLLPELRAAGVELVAVSPQAPDATLSTAEKNALGFDVLSDVGNKAAAAFGVVYVMPDELRALYAQVGHDLPVLNADASWTLPLPATFVIGQDRVVRAAHVEADYRRRLEPADALRLASRARALAAA